MITASNDPVAAAFRRARTAAAPHEGAVAPPLAVVRRRAASVRRRRELVPVAAAAAAILAIAGGTAVNGAFERGSRTTTEGEGTPSRAGRSADGFVLPSDLGAGSWRLSTGDGSAVSEVSLPGCSDGSGASSQQITFAVEGGSVLFRGVASDKEWILDEAVVRLSEADARTARAHLTQFAGCSTTSMGSVLAASQTVLVVGRLLPADSPGPAGAVGFAQAFALSGSTLVRLVTHPGVTGDDTALPGQTRWILDTLGQAVVRATGRTPALPTPNAAAEKAASAYARHPQRGVDTASPAQVPAGFLTLADLGTAGAWSVSDDVTERTSGQLSIQIPSCPGQTLTTVHGQGTTQTYRGWTTGTGPNADSSNAWPLDETVVRLDGGATSTVRTVLGRLAACATVRTADGEMAVRVAEESRVILAREQGNGGVGAVQAWVLRGTTLVCLTTGPDDERQALPGGLPWFTALLDTAERRVSQT
jgi:hypothetical protein